MPYHEALQTAEAKSSVRRTFSAGTLQKTYPGLDLSLLAEPSPSPQTQRVRLWASPTGYEPDPLNKPIYEPFPEILRQASVSRSSAIVHWCDGETNQLNAFNSEEFQSGSADLHLRLLKFNASRSGGEQPLDLSKSFMSGHTQVKHGTHSLRPVSASIKQDLDKGLASFGVELEDKHYTPLLAFLNHAPYMLQQSMSPTVLLPGWEEGNYPVDFNKMAAKCKQFTDMDDDSTWEFVAGLPDISMAYKRAGRVQESEYLTNGIPEDDRLRNDDKNVSHNRALWLNHDSEIAYQSRLQAEKVIVRDSKVQKKLQTEATRKQRLVSEVWTSWRVEERKRRITNNRYCVCESKGVTKDASFMWECDGKRRCPYRGWLHGSGNCVNHPIYTERIGETDSDDNMIIEEYWCEFCFLYIFPELLAD